MKKTLLKFKLKWSQDRAGTYYLTTFMDGKSVVVDSWEYPELFRELLKLYSAPEKVWNSRKDTLRNPNITSDKTDGL